MKQLLLFLTIFILCGCSKDDSPIVRNVLEHIPDEVFKTFCLRFDADGNGELSQKEAEAVTSIDIRYGFAGWGEVVASLEGLEYFTNLTQLNCYGNKLSNLDVSSNTKLRQLVCNNNQLSNLDLSKNTELILLDCRYNQLSHLDLSKNTVLATLGCNNNQLATLNISGCTLLKFLWCHENNNPLTVTVWQEFDTAAPSNTIPYHIEYDAGTIFTKVKP